MTLQFLRARSKHLLAVPLLVAAVGVGFLLSRPASALLHDRIDPHGWLVEHASERIYVSSSCSISEGAVEHLDSSPAGGRFVVVPVDRASSPERDERCRQALQRIGEEGSPWWLILPDSYLCDRLVASARDLGIEAFEGKVPGIVIAGEPLEPGFGESQIERIDALAP